MVTINGVLWSIYLVHPDDWPATKQAYGYTLWCVWNHGKRGSAKSRITKWLYAIDADFDTIEWHCPD